MKRFLFCLGLLILFGMTSCHSKKEGKALLSRDFPTYSWERFDYISDQITIKQPTTFDLSMVVTFDPSYAYDQLTVVFTVFDTDDTPLRSKNYRFLLKDVNGEWKSELKDGGYTFTLPINSQLSLNEPGSYKFQLENRMPITPLAGIRKIALINQMK